MNLVFRNKHTGEVWQQNNSDEFLTLTTDGNFLMWKQDYGRNWYFEDVSDDWELVD